MFARLYFPPRQRHRSEEGQSGSALTTSGLRARDNNTSLGGFLMRQRILELKLRHPEYFPKWSFV